MACTSKEQFHKDINDLNQDLKPQEQIAQVQTKKLNRGTLIIQTSEGPTQFGLPPDTVKNYLKQFYLNYLIKLKIECIQSNFQQDIPFNRKIDIICIIDIFDKLTLNNAKFLLDALKLEKYKEGELVIQENQEGHKFYIIESGLSYFGESVLIQTGRRRALVLAITDLRVLSLDKHNFWFIFGDGYKVQGPVKEQMMQLMEARKQQDIQILFKYIVSQYFQEILIFHNQFLPKKHKQR
ncbi:unnamed protein product [Paramecium sonneborni]|uniref:Cyclic nucleotide-binding domain-containing protein n=1 Tax=Paramecium sonneborni TaxID=65129 RepID=A0A8S1LCX8_9CILI|nr:unnamed protein product [Paramecium sonneborni]